MNQTKTTEGLDGLREHYTSTEEVILRRRSVRKYKNEQVPEWMVKRILEAARFAPSAGNGQPWKFIVIRDRKVIDELTEDVVMKAENVSQLFGKKWIRPLKKTLIRMQPNQLHPTPFSIVPLLAQRKFGLYHGAPTVILILKDVRGIANPDLDCGIAGQNMVLAAHSMGLGTCWVGFTKMVFEANKKWQKFFDIEHPYQFINSIGFGWPAGALDAIVSRQTHAVDWYEDDQKKTIY